MYAKGIRVDSGEARKHVQRHVVVVLVIRAPRLFLVQMELERDFLIEIKSEIVFQTPKYSVSKKIYVVFRDNTCMGVRLTLDLAAYGVHAGDEEGERLHDFVFLLSSCNSLACKLISMLM